MSFFTNSYLGNETSSTYVEHKHLMTAGGIKEDEQKLSDIHALK